MDVLLSKIPGDGLVPLEEMWRDGFIAPVGGQAGDALVVAIERVKTVAEFVTRAVRAKECWAATGL